ncbi:WW domain-binding protein 11-like [Canis lupus familiaris]|uniref:WW domain-binding protein 11-like n=1 Tax=Canis lupus familiaris TaxID=9615 RepID=UPI0018F60D98|nr:WW domain-binding protein 11-like [Canis lupus familiaris]
MPPAVPAPSGRQAVPRLRADPPHGIAVRPLAAPGSLCPLSLGGRGGPPRAPPEAPSPALAARHRRGRSRPLCRLLPPGHRGGRSDRPPPQRTLPRVHGPQPRGVMEPEGDVAAGDPLLPPDPEVHPPCQHPGHHGVLLLPDAALARQRLRSSAGRRPGAGRAQPLACGATGHPHRLLPRPAVPSFQVQPAGPSLVLRGPLHGDEHRMVGNAERFLHDSCSKRKSFQSQSVVRLADVTAYVRTEALAWLGLERPQQEEAEMVESHNYYLDDVSDLLDELLSKIHALSDSLQLPLPEQQFCDMREARAKGHSSAGISA